MFESNSSVSFFFLPSTHTPKKNNKNKNKIQEVLTPLSLPLPPIPLAVNNRVPGERKLFMPEGGLGWGPLATGFLLVTRKKRKKKKRVRSIHGMGWVWRATSFPLNFFPCWRAKNRRSRVVVIMNGCFDAGSVWRKSEECVFFLFFLVCQGKISVCVKILGLQSRIPDPGRLVLLQNLYSLNELSFPDIRFKILSLILISVPYLSSSAPISPPPPRSPQCKNLPVFLPHSQSRACSRQRYYYQPISLNPLAARMLLYLSLRRAWEVVGWPYAWLGLAPWQSVQIFQFYWLGVCHCFGVLDSELCGGIFELGLLWCPPCFPKISG